MRVCNQSIRLRRTAIFAASLLILPFMAAGGAIAGSEHVAGIEQECEAQLGYAPERCECIGDHAEADLNDNQQAFMYAQATGNAAEAQRLQGSMTIDEMTEVGQLMTGIDGICP
ncbi:MAG: hypothetical protein WD711_04715 [Dongiaceae bacterium]